MPSPAPRPPSPAFAAWPATLGLGIDASKPLAELLRVARVLLGIGTLAVVLKFQYLAPPDARC